MSTIISPTPFTRIPNSLITLSLQSDHYLLPLYLYSSINSNPHHNDTVDTNLSLISETFLPSNPSAPSHFLQSLITLSSSSSTLSPTLQLLTPSTSLTKTTRLQYIFLNRSTKYATGWTKFTHQEYFYILDQISSLNSSLTKTKYNAIELINLYAYFKQKISLRSNLSQSTLSQSTLSQSTLSLKTIPPHHTESLDSLTLSTSFSRNTLTKYIHQLSSLKLLTVHHGAFNNSHSKKELNSYSLSSEWQKDY